VKAPWTPWNVTGQTAGFVTVYDTFTYATVVGGGCTRCVCFSVGAGRVHWGGAVCCLCAQRGAGPGRLLPWEPWEVVGVEGWVWHFNAGRVVGGPCGVWQKGAGHEVPLFQPLSSLSMVSNFVKGSFP
jgi:hypothetical protein